jgi:hypothetical protein
MTKYDDEKWVENFRMNKTILFGFVERMRPLILKQNIKYHDIILIEI